MKRLFAVALFATTFLAILCQKETSEGEGGGQQPVAAVPADFDWKMTRDVSAAVGMPSVSGLAPDSVSYTHLTLPTSALVEISVGAGSIKKKKKKDRQNQTLH